VDFEVIAPELAPAGTEERIRDRARSWGFELEPAPIVGGDLLAARAAPVEVRFDDIFQATKDAILREQLAGPGPDDWYLFADPAVDTQVDLIDWKAKFGGLTLPSRLDVLWGDAAPEVRQPLGGGCDPYSIDFDAITVFKFSFSFGIASDPEPDYFERPPGFDGAAPWAGYGA
jgi:hypothetical protein